MSNNSICWRPSAEFISQSNLKQLEAWLERERGLSFADSQALWQWSVDNVADFWQAMSEYFQVIFHQPFESVLSDEGMPNTQWFSGSTLNYAEHIFRHRNTERPALWFQQEGEALQSVSWDQLESQVKAVQTYLRAQGIGQGDCVAAYLPNIPEAIACFLAVNSLGAVWSCCSPDFGVSTVIDRFTQIQPKLLLAVDGYRYNGKPFSRVAEVRQIQEAIPSIQQTLFIPYLEKTSQLEEATLWSDCLQSYSSEAPLSFSPVPFAHPIWVLYSSGTTGKPKAITHSNGGTLLEHLKYVHIHNDVKAGENYFWFTTTGWMMWNFLQATMLAGAVPVLYDGSPGFPNLNSLWKLAAELPIHHFGTSAPYLVACMKRDLTPGKDFDLSHLRSISSTGAPLPPEAFDWVYESVKEDLWLASMSGGTDVCTAFVGGWPDQVVHRGRIQGRALGCALYAYSESGDRLEGELGEMVIERPMPSMPIYFWNDPDNQRYHSSYFDTFPGKWRHGDWIQLYPDGSLIIQGRSDATLNRKGVRIGTAEIYSILDGIEELQDALVLNLEKPNGDDVMPLFVQLKPAIHLDEALTQKINTALRKQGSPRHVPDLIIPVPDIPYTLSGKKMEVPIKKILLGMSATKSMNKDATKNPEALETFIELATRFREEYL